MWTSLRWLVSVLVVVSCKQNPSGPSPERPSALASAPDQDALWAIAPADTQVGVVASPRGVASIEHAWAAASSLLASSADFAPLHSRVMRALNEAVGSIDPTLAELGLSRDKGFALFVRSDGDHVAVLPVADRARFLAQVDGSQGADGDLIRGMPCRIVQAMYVCAERADVFAKLGQGRLGDLRKAAGARGDIELVAQLGTAAGPAVSVVAQLDRGAVILRGSVVRAPAIVTSKLGPATRPPSSHAAAGYGVMNLAPFLERVPAVPIVGDVTFAALAASVAGPMTYAIAPGAGGDLGIRVPLSDPAPARAVIEGCERIPGLAERGAKLENGVCHFADPGLKLELDLWLDGKELRIGKHQPTPTAAPWPSSPIGQALASEAWSIGVYGRGTVANVPATFGQAMSQLPDEVQLLVQVMSLVNELAIGVRADGDTVRFLLAARTAWANPDEVVRRLLALPLDPAVAGSSIAEAEQIAAAAPASPFATDVRAGAGGAISLVAPIAILTAVVVPVAMDAMKRPAPAPNTD